MKPMPLIFRRLPLLSLALLHPAVLVAAASTAQATSQAETEPAKVPTLPLQTNRYNRGGFPGRYRDADGKAAKFELAQETAVRDGSGREIGRARRPVMLNIGAVKKMAVGDKGVSEAYLWAWQTEAGSGWIARKSLVKPPVLAPPDPLRNPRPPREAPVPMTIDAAAGTRKLTGLRHVNSQGVIPAGGGNRGEHYAGRNPKGLNFVYLLFATPNVRGGGTAQDSLPHGSTFLPARNEAGKPIQEVVTMYRGGDMKQPVPITFVYGRVPGGDRWGWVARANFGEL